MEAKRTRGSRPCSSFLLCVVLVVCFASRAFAAPVIVDPDRAKERSLRAGRDPIEGYWGVYHNWYPVWGASRSYRVAIVRNDFGVFPKARYLGVVMCKKPGCTRGEVRFLFTPTSGGEGRYDAVFRTGSGDVRGYAHLAAKQTGEPDSVIDMRALKMKGHSLTNYIVRIEGM